MVHFGWGEVMWEFPVILTFWDRFYGTILDLGLTKSTSCQNYYRFDDLMSKSLSFWRPLVILSKNGPFCWKNSPSFWLLDRFFGTILGPRIDKKYLMSKLLSFWKPLVKITIVAPSGAFTDSDIPDKMSLASGRPSGRPAPQEPRLKTSKRCRFFWTPKRVVFGINLALKCPIFVTFLTSPEIDQKRTLLLEGFHGIFTFRVVFTRHSVTPDWQKALVFKITIVLTASCQNRYRFEGLWSFIFCGDFLVIFDTPVFGHPPF